jgi:innexin
MRRLGSFLCCSIGRHSGNYLAITYVVTKLLYIGNAIGQLFLLNLFMGRGFHLMGIQTLQRWWNGQDVEALERFPRITMCKFSIRTLGDNIQPYDVQCLLPINIYNEKVSRSKVKDKERWSCCRFS